MGLVNRDDGWRIPDWLWERIEPLLPPRPEHPLGCHNPRVPDRDAMNAILLVLRTGMQWNAQRHRGLPLEFCPPALSRLGAGRGLPRDLAPGPARPRHRDRHRLVVAGGRRGDDQGDARWRTDGLQSHRQSQKGAKRSLLTEAAGIPIGIAHEGAQRHDKKLPEPTLASVPIGRPIPDQDHPQGLCLDRGFGVDDVRELAIRQRFEPHIRTRGEELALKERQPEWRPRRWVVEACHSWLNRNRALLIRWSKKEDNHLALLQLASGLIAFKKAHAARTAPA
jgi:transposase